MDTSNIMRYLYLGFLILLLASCGGQRIEDLQTQIYNLQFQIQNQEKRVSALETQVAQLTKEAHSQGKDIDRVNVLANRQADLFAELEKIQAEQLRLNGQLEQLTYQQEQDREAFREFQAEMAKRLSAIEKRLEGTPSSQSKPSEDNLYSQALNLYKQKKYLQAQKEFEKYLRLYPHGKRAPNAHFWIGEALFQRKLYEEAILEYQKVIDQFPKSNKVPAALLKQAFAFLHLGDTEAAKIVFKKLIQKYPKSDQARIAKRYMAKLKKS